MLGCGNALFNDWINVDCYPPEPEPGSDILVIDMRHGLPFGDQSVEILFSEHFLEHLPIEIVKGSVLPEVRRILRPGGFLRFSIPNGEYFIQQYLKAKSGQADPIYNDNRHGETPMTILNGVTHGGGHHFLYDFETLAVMLKELGFINIRQAYYGDSECEELVDKDRKDDWRIAMSLYIEAQVSLG